MSDNVAIEADREELKQLVLWHSQRIVYWLNQGEAGEGPAGDHLDRLIYMMKKLGIPPSEAAT